MKTISAVLMLLALVATAQDDPKPGDDVTIYHSDTRLVNGKSVDLMPLHNWYSKPEGERPLKHWKKLQLITPKGQFAGKEKCVFKLEQGGMTEVLMTHLPSRLTQYVQTFKAQEAEIARLSAEIESDMAEWRRQNAVAPTGAYGSAQYVDGAMALRNQANLYGVTITEKKERLERLKAEHETWLINSAKNLTLFAMYTGQKYAGFEIWDCGYGGNQ